MGTHNAYTPARAGKPSRQPMKRPTEKHGGERMERYRRAWHHGRSGDYYYKCQLPLLHCGRLHNLYIQNLHVYFVQASIFVELESQILLTSQRWWRRFGRRSRWCRRRFFQPRRVVIISRLETNPDRVTGFPVIRFTNLQFYSIHYSQLTNTAKLFLSDDLWINIKYQWYLWIPAIAFIQYGTFLKQDSGFSGWLSRFRSVNNNNINFNI